MSEDVEWKKDQLRMLRDQVDWDTQQENLDKWKRSAENWRLLADQVCSQGGQSAFSEHWEGPAATAAQRAFAELAAMIRGVAGTVDAARMQVEGGVMTLKQIAAEVADHMDETEGWENLGFGGFDEDKFAREQYQKMETEIPPIRDQLGQLAKDSSSFARGRKDSGLLGGSSNLPGAPAGGIAASAPTLGGGVGAPTGASLGSGGPPPPLGSGPPPHLGGGPPPPLDRPGVGDHTSPVPTSGTGAEAGYDPYSNTGVTADGALSGTTGTGTSAGSGLSGYTPGSYGSTPTGGSSGAGLLGGSAAAGGVVGGAAGSAAAASRAAGARGPSGGSTGSGLGAGGTSSASGSAAATGSGARGGSAASSGSAGGRPMGMMGGGGMGGGAGGSGAGGGTRYGSGPKLGPGGRRRGPAPKHAVLGAGSRKSKKDNRPDEAQQNRRPAVEDDDDFYDED